MDFFEQIFSNPHFISLFGLGASYISEKILDGLLEKNFDEYFAGEIIFGDLIDSLNKALKSTCIKYNWIYDETAMEETVCCNSALWQDCNSIDKLSHILSKAIGQEFSQNELAFWLEAFEQEVAVHQNLHNYLHSKQTKEINAKTSDPLSNHKKSLKETLWLASQQNYILSHRKGNRFYSLDILQQLLPHGYIENNRFVTRGKKEDGTIAPLMNLCFETSENISVVGDGGIGKTTFLQQLLKNEFLFENGTLQRFVQKRQVPFFIELNRCPEHINEWYDDSLRKTNFITRYIGQLKENHCSLDSVSEETLTEIEKEFQKIPQNGQADFLLLLDGFNEVRPDNMIRKCLSNEISILNTYPNIRIITTSRETHAAYFAKDFTNIRLIGLKSEDIITYLKNLHFEEPFIGNVMSCKSLVKCLQIPLYLCMFSAQKADYNYLPETAGEILHCFFHRNSNFYNARARAAEARTGNLSDAQIAFVLDFILPYIGWCFERKNIFSMNCDEFDDTVKTAMLFSQALFTRGQHCPFSDFNYSSLKVEAVANSLYLTNGEVDIQSIISCIYDYLGIVYQYQINEGNFADRVRYSFCHHHFRDYFSAVWDVHLLFMLQCVSPNAFFTNLVDSAHCSFNQFLNSYFWQTQKVSFISQILMEHRNKPILNPNSEDWYLPDMIYDEQKVLSNTLNFCRQLCDGNNDIHHILQNVLSAILYGRKELSGINLSELDLKKCSLFNINCSKKGKHRFLSANFNKSTLYEENFSPEGHQNSIMEYVYFKNNCFTIDDCGIIKCWDVPSGKLEYELQSDNPLGLYDFTNKGHIKISNDGNWLITKVQKTDSKGTDVFVNLFNLNKPNDKPIKFAPPKTHKILSFFGFTDNSKNILFICDRDFVYCFDIQTKEMCYSHEVKLYKHSEVFSNDSSSPIYVFTAEYDEFISDEQLIDGYSDDDEEKIPIICDILKIDPQNGKNVLLYNFFSAPSTSPTITFIPHNSAFIFYNYDTDCIEIYDCINCTVRTVLHELRDNYEEIPSAIHCHPEHINEYYIMYPDACFNVDISDINKNSIIMKYSVYGIEKLLPNSGENGELIFNVNVVPTNNRFIVSNDSNTYEWDLENESVILKYNCAYYECVALFLLKSPQTFALVHFNNGVSIFGGSPVRLQNQICFYEPEYFIGNCCYDKIHNMLAITFVRPEHEKVVLLHIDTEKQYDVFSTIHKNESVVNLCFSEDGKNLLITSQYQCLEHSIISNKTFTVAKAGANERMAGGNYNKNYIEIAVVEDTSIHNTRVTPHCDYYSRIFQKSNRKYIKEWYYIIPQLNQSQFPFFIYSNSDSGIQGSNDKMGMQDYWVTRGFFIEESKETKNIMSPQCFAKKKNGFSKCHKKFSALDMIYVKHSAAISYSYDTQYISGNTYGKYSYMYLSDDMRDAVFTDSNERLLYIQDLSNIKYKDIQEGFKQSIGNASGNAYWDFAIPWSNNSLIGCYESYNLIKIDLNTGTLQSEIEYYPGISINECSFNAVKADSIVKNIIKYNSGSK